MSGRLTIVGVGPGEAHLVTPAVSRVLAEATDLVGYGPYLDRVPAVRANQVRHASDNRVEVQRAQEALRLAASGKSVAVVSGGDPGVFAMAAAVFEAIEAGEPQWRDLDVRVEPGVTAMLAAAARGGCAARRRFLRHFAVGQSQELGHDLAKRLKAAAEGDFVIALYNPALEGAAASDRRGVRGAAGREESARRSCCSCARPARRRRSS